MYKMARNSRLSARNVTIAENKDAKAQRWRLYTTVLSSRVLSFLNFELYLAIDSFYSKSSKSIIVSIMFVN
jgi:hypothetical protein